MAQWHKIQNDKLENASEDGLQLPFNTHDWDIGPTLVDWDAIPYKY
jgi:hypothetical protein